MQDLRYRARELNAEQRFAPALECLKDAAETARRAWGITDPDTRSAALAWAEMLEKRGSAHRAADVRKEFGLVPTTTPALPDNQKP